MRPFRRFLALCALLSALPLYAPAHAQAPAWRVTTSPSAGLWFHGLALSGSRGFGVLPLYGPGYRGDLTRARAEPGLPSGGLEEESAEFTAAFAADSAFEMLHFIPLWFPVSSAPDMLDALLRATQSGADALRETGPRERFGVGVMLGTLPTSSQRRTLGQFVTALRREWVEGYSRLHARLIAPERAAEVEAVWQPLALALAPYLTAQRLSSGVVLLVPSLGPDGRFFGGDPRNPADNVVAVRLAPGEPAERAVFRMVRELCYPTVRAALGKDPVPDAVAGERVSGMAAVRCGHDLLARYAPSTVARYDAQWISDAGRSGTFEQIYPLPDGLAARLASREAGWSR
jgi:hypothetical protein